MLTYPYQANVVPVGCYCQSGFQQHCASKPAQTLQHRTSFYADWDAAQQDPRVSQAAAQHFALRYGWRARDTIKTLLEHPSPKLMPYLSALAQQPVQASAQGIYDAMLNRAF